MFIFTYGNYLLPLHQDNVKQAPESNNDKVGYALIMTSICGNLLPDMLQMLATSEHGRSSFILFFLLGGLIVTESESTSEFE
uniref:Uncharacterized protein n=1 Tax=Acrobeloides nanus TaxID=290746 RepID=A0A914CR69_9BILA